MKGKIIKKSYKSNAGNTYEGLELVCHNGMTFKIYNSKSYDLNRLEKLCFDVFYKGTDTIEVDYFLHKDVSNKNNEYYYIDFEYFPNYIKKVFIDLNIYIALGGK